jgi:hypothetical protein
MMRTYVVRGALGEHRLELVGDHVEREEVMSVVCGRRQEDVGSIEGIRAFFIPP